MKKLKIIISIFVFCMIVSLFNTCYAASITKENIEQALKDFFTYFEQENTDIKITNFEITDDNIKFDMNEQNVDAKYYISDEKVIVESSFKASKNMKYEDYEKEQSEMMLSDIVMYSAIAKIKGVGYEETMMNYLFTILGKVLNFENKKDMYVIIDDTNLSDGVTINKNEDNKNIIYASEFGKYAVEYTKQCYSNMDISDELNTYNLKSEIKNVTEDSCEVFSKFTINLDADFSKISEVYKEKLEDFKNKIENNIGNLNSLINVNNSNNNTINNSNNEETKELPKAGINFNYSTAINIICILGCLGLGSIILISLFKKKQLN